MSKRTRFFTSLAACCLLATLLSAQNPQDRSARPATRPAPGGPPPTRPGNPSPGRPGGGGPNRPQPQPPRPNPSRPNPGPRPPRPNPRPPVRPNRPPQWGRPPQHRPSYHFRPRDRDYLLRHYRRHLAYINRARRPIFRIGGFFPIGDIGYLSPVPPDIYGYLPPPPPGYQVGYFDGYVVVYDPITYFIANLVDLLN